MNNNLTIKEKQEIAESATDNFDGDVSLAAAAHVHGVGVVARVGGKIAEWFDRETIDSIETQVKAYLDNKAKKAKKAKK